MRRGDQRRMEGRGGEIAGERPDDGLGTDLRDFLHGVREGEVRVALQLCGLEHHMPHRVAIRADEASPLIVEGQPVLPLPADEFERARPRVIARVARREHDRCPLRVFRRGHRAAVEATREVDPAVRAERGMTEANLRGAGGVETGQHDAPLVGDSVPVGVLQVQQVGRHRHEDAAVPHHQAVGIRQARGKVRTRVVAAIVVGVGQQRDDTAGRFGGLPLEGIGVATVLRDEEPAALVERNRDGILHERLRRDEIDAIAGLDARSCAARRPERAHADRRRDGASAPVRGRPASGSTSSSDTPANHEQRRTERSRSHRTTHRAAARDGCEADRSASISSKASVMMRAASSSTRLVPSHVS